LQWIAQRAAEVCESDLHYVSGGEANAFAVAETIGAEEMDMDVAWAAMRFIFEVVMLDVAEAVAHFGFARADFFMPQRFTGAFDRDFARDGIESRIERNFGP